MLSEFRTLGESLSIIREKVEKMEPDLRQVKEDVVVLKAAARSHTDAIAANTEAIAANTEAIREMKGTLAGHTEAIHAMQADLKNYNQRLEVVEAKIAS